MSLSLYSYYYPAVDIIKASPDLQRISTVIPRRSRFTSNQRKAWLFGSNNYLLALLLALLLVLLPVYLARYVSI